MIRQGDKTDVKRAGYTLVELLAVITVTAFLLGVVGIVTHTLARAQRATLQVINSRRTLSQLSLQFRADAHAATSVVADPHAVDGPLCTMTMVSDDRVQYRIKSEPPEVERVIVRGDADIGREVYCLAAGDSARLEPIAKELPRLVTLVITSVPRGQPAAKGRERRIVAAVGLIRDPHEAMSEPDDNPERRES